MRLGKALDNLSNSLAGNNRKVHQVANPFITMPKSVSYESYDGEYLQVFPKINLGFHGFHVHPSFRPRSQQCSYLVVQHFVKGEVPPQWFPAAMCAMDWVSTVVLENPRVRSLKIPLAYALCGFFTSASENSRFHRVFTEFSQFSPHLPWVFAVFSIDWSASSEQSSCQLPAVSPGGLVFRVSAAWQQGAGHCAPVA